MKNHAFPAAACAAALFALSGAAHAQHTGGGSPFGVKERAATSRPDAPEALAPGAAYRLGGSSTMEVSVNRDLKTSIRDRLIRLAAGRAVPRASLGGLRLTPGHVVPREKVRIRRLPADVVEIAPEYTNYEYFVVEGGSIVIVDPRSYEIMDMIPA